jgi:lipopolysaccharide/colanic/teichoic acid biosynthesis glycosyltransferase
VFDIGFAAVALTLTLPLMILIIAAIRFTSPGPAFYRHRRVGLRGRPFDCLKFRTMVTDADKVLEELLDSDLTLREEFDRKYKLTEDPRVTGVGKILRKTSLDELPQFWNIMTGDMGVVGPRPLVADETGRYGPDLPLVLSVRPGLTGLWQVSGRNDTTYEERVELDRRYVLERSLGTDLKIIAKTVGVMVRRENGAY